MRLTWNYATPTNFVSKFIVFSFAIALIVTAKTSLAQQSNADEVGAVLELASTTKQPLLQLTEVLAQIAQAPEVQVNPAPPGIAPSLETEPSTAQEKPFQPQNLPLVPLESRGYSIAPNITVITPSAYGKSWGNISVGLGLQERTRFTNEADGVLGVGIGLGDAQKAIALDVGVTVTDLDTAEDGTLSFKLHRQLPNDFGVAVGVLNAIDWGLTDSGRSFYGAVTKRFRLQSSDERLFSQLYISAGIGSGQFRSESNINENIDSVGFFGSVAVRVAEPVNLITEWTGQDLTIGLSVLPFRNIPLVITPGVSDITGNAGNGSRFILGVGYLISF